MAVSSRIVRSNAAATAAVTPPANTDTPPVPAVVLVDGAGNLLAATDNGDGTATLNSSASLSVSSLAINDGTTTSRKATVSAGGALLVDTQAIAATRTSATTMQSAATGNGNGTSLNVQGYAVALLNVVSSVAMAGGTTINFEASVDDTTWVAIAAHTIGTNGSLATTTTADGDYRVQTAGYKSVRARISGYSAGTVTVKGYAVATPSAPTAVALAASTANIGTVTSATPAATTNAVAFSAAVGTPQVVSATAKDYRGFSLRETAGANAVVRVYDNGSAASGTILDTISLGANESVREFYSAGGGVKTSNGIVVQLVSGAVEGSIRTA